MVILRVSDPRRSQHACRSSTRSTSLAQSPQRSVGAGPQGVAAAHLPAGPRRPSARRSAGDPARRGDRGGRPGGRDDPDRDRRPQLPGQRPQQLAARLQQQRLDDHPASPTRPASNSSACSRTAAAPAARSISRTRSTRPASTANNAARAGQGLERPRRGQERPAELRWAMQMRARRDLHDRQPDPAGAQQRRPARTRSTRSPRQMARFYASDVLYKSYTLPLIAGALKSAGTPPAGRMPAVQRRSVPARRAMADPVVRRPACSTCSRPARPPAAPSRPPGLHGHSLDSVSVGGTTLQTGSDNTRPGEPAAAVHAELHQRRHQHRAQRQSARSRWATPASPGRRPCRRPPRDSTPPARSRSTPRRRPATTR